MQQISESSAGPPMCMLLHSVPAWRSCAAHEVCVYMTLPTCPQTRAQVNTLAPHLRERAAPETFSFRFVIGDQRSRSNVSTLFSLQPQLLEHQIRC